MEATGGWSEELAFFMSEHGHAVSIVNPKAIKAFGESELSRTKTDKADAALIARYCRAMQPRLWVAPSPSQRRLQSLVRRRGALVEMRTKEINRLEGPGIGETRPSLEKSIAFFTSEIAHIDQEIRSLIDDDPKLGEQRDLLESIPGVGPGLSATLLGELPQITEFRSGKALSAFVGMCPREYRSGTSISKSWLSGAGNGRVRAMLYMPAIAAVRCNPILKEFAIRLRANGKRPKQVLAAVMRRLLVIAYGVLKSGRPFAAVAAT